MTLDRSLQHETGQHVSRRLDQALADSHAAHQSVYGDAVDGFDLKSDYRYDDAFPSGSIPTNPTNAGVGTVETRRRRYANMNAQVKSLLGALSSIEEKAAGKYTFEDGDNGATNVLHDGDKIGSVTGSEDSGFTAHNHIGGKTKHKSKESAKKAIVNFHKASKKRSSGGAGSDTSGTRQRGTGRIGPRGSTKDDDIDDAEFKARRPHVSPRHVRTGRGEQRYRKGIGTELGGSGRIGATKYRVGTKVNSIEVNHGVPFGKRSEPIVVTQHTPSGKLNTRHPNMASADAHIDAILEQHGRIGSVTHTMTDEHGQQHQYRINHDGTVAHKAPGRQSFRAAGKLVQHNNGEMSLGAHREDGLSDTLTSHMLSNQPEGGAATRQRGTGRIGPRVTASSHDGGKHWSGHVDGEIVSSGHGSRQEALAEARRAVGKA